MKLKYRQISSRTLLIIILIAIIILLFIIPLEKMVGKPSILGAVVSKVFVRSLASNQTCSIDLAEGWNLVSTSCVPQNTSVDFVLASISGNYSSIHTYNASVELDYWKAYDPSMPSWVVQDLDSISEKKGYWIKVTGQDILVVNGTVSVPTSVSLENGWNLVGYPASTAKTPADAFSSISGSYSIVWAYNTSESTYYYYNPSLGSGTLGQISPNRGYWINMTEDDTWWVT